MTDYRTPRPLPIPSDWVCANCAPGRVAAGQVAVKTMQQEWQSCPDCRRTFQGAEFKLYETPKRARRASQPASH